MCSSIYDNEILFGCCTYDFFLIPSILFYLFIFCLAILFFLFSIEKNISFSLFLYMLNIGMNIAIIFAAINQSEQNPRWNWWKNQCVLMLAIVLYLGIWPFSIKGDKMHHHSDPCTLHTRQCKQQHVCRRLSI